MQQRVQQQQLIRRRMAAMNSRITNSSGSGVSSSSGALSPGSSVQNSSSSSSSSSHHVPQQHSPHAPGMGVKPGALTPPPSVLQALKQVSHKLLLILILYNTRWFFFVYLFTIRTTLLSVVGFSFCHF